MGIQCWFGGKWGGSFRWQEWAEFSVHTWISLSPSVHHYPCECSSLLSVHCSLMEGMFIKGVGNNVLPSLHLLPSIPPGLCVNFASYLFQIPFHCQSHFHGFFLNESIQKPNLLPCAIWELWGVLPLRLRTKKVKIAP